MTSEEQPTAAGASAPDLLEITPAGSPGERARALLRARPYRRLWIAQLVSSVGDRLGLLVLLALTVLSSALTGQFGGGYRGLAFTVAAVLAVRLLAALVFGLLLLRPVHDLVGGRFNHRWTLLGADVLRAALLGVAPWWLAWTHQTATWLLLGTVFLTGACERIWSIVKDATAPALLPVTNPPPLPAVGPKGSIARQAEQRPSTASLESVRTLDQRTGWAAIPLGALALVGLTLVNNVVAALGSQWFRANQVTCAALGAALLFAASAVLLYLQELPAGAFTPPSFPFQGLRAPTDATPGAALRRGRTGTAPYFTFAVAAAYASMAGVAALGLLTATEHRAGPIGYGLLVLAAAGTPAVGARIARATLPGLSRRRLLALGLLITGVALILAGLVFDYVLVLLLTVLAGLAAGVVIATGRTLLAQEVEEIRLHRVTEHLFAVLRATVAAALVIVPLIAAAYGQLALGQAQPGGFTFVHGGAGLAVSTAGLLTLALAAVVLLKADDQRGTVPFARELVQALRGGPARAPHRTSGTGFFIALEGGDGAGKSTQVQALAEWIRGKGHEVVVTREPGGSPVGQRLRGLVLDVGNTGLSHRAEALIYAADRAEHVENVIRPALERGAVVITDRYLDSSIAYQGAGRDLAATEIAWISRWATGGLVADLTVVLDIDPAAARERFTEALDRLESEPTEFHARVREGFLALAAADPSRYLVVDAGRSAESVTTAIRHRLDRELPLSAKEQVAKTEQERLARQEAERRAAEEARLKAEAAEAERKREELLEQLRAEQAERDRLVREQADQRAAEAAARAAEEARLKAEEEARRLAEEEAVRRAAEEVRLRAEAAERARLEAEAAAQAEFQRQREEHRAEQRRRAEEALQRAEEARLAAAAAARAGSSAAQPGAAQAAADESAHAERDSSAWRAEPAERTVELPQPGAEQPTRELPRPADPTAAAQAQAAGAPASASDETAVLPAVPASPADETAVLPRIPKAAPDETALLPRVASDAATDPSAAGVRLGEGLFRDEPHGSTAATTQEFPAPSRQRPEWAEETPMDDLPSLTDTLLGSRAEWAHWEQAEPGEDGPKKRRRHRD